MPTKINDLPDELGIRDPYESERRARADVADITPDVNHGTPPALTEAPSVEQTVQAWHSAGQSQRAIARGLNIDRRKVKRIIDQAT